MSLKKLKPDSLKGIAFCIRSDLRFLGLMINEETLSDILNEKMSAKELIEISLAVPGVVFDWDKYINEALDELQELDIIGELLKSRVGVLDRTMFCKECDYEANEKEFYSEDNRGHLCPECSGEDIGTRRD